MSRTSSATWGRISSKGACRLELDHYLEALVRKAGALSGATALDQAPSAGKFTPVHDAWWQAACKADGDVEGTRALIDVLLLHRHMPHDHVVSGIATALRAGAMTADAVALEAPQGRRGRQRRFCCVRLILLPRAEAVTGLETVSVPLTDCAPCRRSPANHR
ncbi:hypothetical protein [Streptomyces sp. SAS_267]|uniref:hypothetical protein n=1 Tax=Streptomyces sp. SAS_267 TaxID=3412750 RepID=UPI00403D32B4